jgi:hypothetical protein
MSRIALFTAPKPFIDPHIDLIQRNAIRNWKALGDEVEIWLVGNEPGIKEVASEYHVNHIPDVLLSETGVPRIDSIFGMVRDASTAEAICYVNADILFLPDFVSAAKALFESGKKFLAIGRRWDVEITEPCDYSEGWPDRLSALIDTARLHRPAGSDYFLLRRDCLTQIPPFLVGRSGWDNWMIFKGRQDGLAVVDCTNSITILHQKHDYHHIPNGKIHRLQPDSLINVDLAGGYETMFQLQDSNYYLQDSRVQAKKMDHWRFGREFTIFPLVTLKSRWLGKLFFELFNSKEAAKFKKRRQLIEEGQE